MTHVKGPFRVGSSGFEMGTADLRKFGTLTLPLQTVYFTHNPFSPLIHTTSRRFLVVMALPLPLNFLLSIDFLDHLHHEHCPLGSHASISYSVTACVS